MKTELNKIKKICQQIAKKHIALNSEIITELRKQKIKIDREETRLLRGSPTGVAVLTIDNEEYIVRRDANGKYHVMGSDSPENMKILQEEHESIDNIADDNFLKKIGEL